MTNRVFNFSAGPAVLPLPVLEKAQAELTNYQDCGMSVMEMSHRSKEFTGIMERAESGLRRLLNIPDDYAVLFLQGGASLQFSMVPMNLYLQGKPVDIIHSGSWTKKAIAEHKKLCEYRLAASTEADNFLRLPKMDEIELTGEASYVYMCSNNTIFGTQFKQFPETGGVPLVADMSSDILSRPLDISKFGLIFAGAQKNIGPSGVTVVIVRKDLAERASENLPTMLQYRTHINGGSLYNTPPTFAIYMSMLVFEWLLERGGIPAMQKINEEKARILYQAIDDNGFFYSPIPAEDRSTMNVVFRVAGDNEELEKKFVAEAAQNQLCTLKGHRSVGGLRASIYNAFPLEGVKALADFMADFAQKNG
ncbi:MAG: 3-phosphoserine/phosphohydroxythreonine transaminase [Candidatus Omnitrophica bacterium]|nr:3-phosphoserine/phosphohydroxythreonine transaminase [Candidatus Omnitrophota bacterium]